MAEMCLKRDCLRPERNASHSSFHAIALCVSTRLTAKSLQTCASGRLLPVAKGSTRPCRAFHRLHSGRLFRRLAPPTMPERHAPLHTRSLSHLPPKPIVVAPPWIKSGAMKKFVGSIAGTLTGEGCTVVDAKKRAKLVIADLRDVAEPGRFRF